MRLLSAPFVCLFLAAVASSSIGCELVASVDRSLIPGEGGGAGGAGVGGATTTSSGGGGSASTSSGGGGSSTTAQGGGGSSSTGGGGAAQGGGGNGGSGGGECTTLSDCPGTDDDCQQRTCIGNVCGHVFTNDGVPVTNQTDLDCLVVVCDGSGGERTDNDDTDLPDDQNPCTVDSCDMGAPVHDPAAATVPCGTMGHCDGVLGVCVGCGGPTDCPGVDDECRTRTCTANVCGFDFEAPGTPVTDPTDGDCQKAECDNLGNIVSVDDDSDLPDDSDDCTENKCTSGNPSNPPESVGTACNQNGGHVCNAAGACVECVNASTCPGSDTECQTRTCTAGACGFSFTAANTAVTAQTPKDCQKDVCNGAGVITQIPDNNDLPVDNNPCTQDKCTAGVPSNPPGNSGGMCGTGGFCNGSGQCVGCNAPADCPAAANECQTVTCNSNVCGFDPVPVGTPTTGGQTPGDCQQKICDGAGGITTQDLDTDKPVDANACTQDVCSAGVPSNPAEPSGTTCTGGLCNGSGACVACLQPNDCPGGPDTDCHVRTCNANVCGIQNTAVNTPTTAQTSGNCKKQVCDGNGGTQQNTDTADVPVDGNVCTQDICTGSTPSNPPVTPAGMLCTGGVCDAAGQCVGCNAPGDCAGVDTECQMRTCTLGVCGFSNQANGTVVSSQTAGDCKRNECDGNGNIAARTFDTDLPVDAFQCTQNICSGGVPSNPPEPQTTVCNEGSGTHCDGAGACVECNGPADCGADTECRTFSCTAGACSSANLMEGMPTVGGQSPGDCHTKQCASGLIVNAIDDADKPNDGIQCTQNVCTAGAPSNPPEAGGVACTQNGGTICDGAGVCTQPFSLMRLGDGSTALGGVTFPVFIEKRYASNGGLVTGATNPIAIPTTTSAPMSRVTLTASANSEGELIRSGDGHYITFAGYDADINVANVGSTASFNRIPTRIDAAGAIDSSTRITSLISGSNVRGAATDDGSRFWVTGGTNGVVTIPLGTSGGTSILAIPANTRDVGVFAGQLYGTAATGVGGNFFGVFTVGTGTPTTAGQTATLLPGMPTATASPFGFVIFPSLNRVYVGDNRATASGGGLQRWDLIAGTWTLGATFTKYNNGVSTVTSAFSQLTGYANGPVVTLIATTATAASPAPNFVVVYSDDGTATDPTGVQIAAAGANTVFRGVALSPQ